MTFAPLSVVTARIMSDLYRQRAERIDQADKNLREFVEADRRRLDDLEAGLKPNRVRA
jgi:hypothetical protein